MGQHIRLGGAFVHARRCFHAYYAFQAFEGQLNAPAQAAEGEDIGGGGDPVNVDLRH
jgi:hypothetical protein